MPYRLHPTGALDVAAEDYAHLSEAQARWDELRAASQRQAWIEDRQNDKEPSE